VQRARQDDHHQPAVWLPVLLQLHARRDAVDVHREGGPRRRVPADDVRVEVLEELLGGREVEGLVEGQQLRGCNTPAQIKATARGNNVVTSRHAHEVRRRAMQASALMPLPLAAATRAAHPVRSCSR